MFEVTGVDYKWVLRELEEYPQEVVSLCTGSDESSLSPYLEITNLVTSFDLEVLHNKEELIQELSEEFKQYGHVKHILIPPLHSEYEGKVYVEYQEVEEVASLICFDCRQSELLKNCGVACLIIDC